MIFKQIFLTHRWTSNKYYLSGLEWNSNERVLHFLWNSKAYIYIYIYIYIYVYEICLKSNGSGCAEHPPVPGWNNFKGIIKWTRFKGVEVIKRALTMKLGRIPEKSFHQCIETCQKRNGKYIRLGWHYFVGKTMYFVVLNWNKLFVTPVLLLLRHTSYIYIYIYIYICICVCVCVCVYVVPSMSIQTFFVQAFKIIIDSWTFSIFLLYILWDDWQIFMISRSNQQLQHQLECTLLMPGCHSWWFSKMRSEREEEWYTIKFCF